MKTVPGKEEVTCEDTADQSVPPNRLHEECRNAT